MTKEQLEHFCILRNESLHDSNFQVQVDADSAGFSVNDLGQARKVEDDSGFIERWEWETPHGTLVENRCVGAERRWSLR